MTWAGDPCTAIRGSDGKREISRRVQVWPSRGDLLKKPGHPLPTYNFRAVWRGHGWVRPFGGRLGAVTDGWGGLGSVIQVHGGVRWDSTDLAGAVAQDVLLIPLGGSARQVTAGQIHRVWLQCVLWPWLLRDDVMTHRVGSWAGRARSGDPGRGRQLTADLPLHWGWRQRNIQSSQGQETHSIRNHVCKIPQRSPNFLT